MPLLGKAAMVLSFDIVPEAVQEHDDWHTHEHLPERLSIPGFLRGTRWKALRGQPGYLVMYEVQDLGTLTSDPYLQRLNNPTSWTSKVMPSYRGMARGLCVVVASHGVGMGHFGLLIKFEPGADGKADLVRWLVEDVLPGLPAKPGLGSVHLLEAATPPPMTIEQRIRGADSGVSWAMLVTGYSKDSLEALSDGGLSKTAFQERGAREVASAVYQNEYTLTSHDIDA